LPNKKKLTLTEGAQKNKWVYLGWCRLFKKMGLSTALILKIMEKHF